jgi:NAD dependent epimerase/dehydratase family enzyme
MPTPGFMLRVALGEVANLVTQGQRVLPRRGQELGYTFRFRDIAAALNDVLAEPVASQ